MNCINPSGHTGAACICTLRTLDRPLWIKAAETAIAVNPANAPERYLYTPMAPDLVLPPEHLAVLTRKYWGSEGVRLTVGFLDSPSVELRARILTHLNAWGQHANVVFVETATSPQVRISRGAGGYWSYLGTDVLLIPADLPTMNLEGFTMSTSDAEFIRVIRHEAGHTLGFPHEHKRQEIVSRIDRQKAIAYFAATNNWPEAKTIEQVLTPIDHSALIATTQADPTSIMCYWLPATIMKDGIAVLGGADINGIDAAFAASVYPKPPYAPVFRQIDPGTGIAGYDLRRSIDRGFAFDYDHSGKTDHIVFFRPGAGAIFVIKHNGGTFSPVYSQIDPGGGIGGYDLKGPTDQGFAFDYDHSGKLDHMVLYRPGTGAIFILKNSGGVFSPVYSQIDPGGGIGGYDLKRSSDQAFAFDYDHSGKLDHIVLFRPGTGAIFILKNSGGAFSSVYSQIDPGGGIGGFDLKGPSDQAFAFDYDHSGKMDHLVLYRPGTGAIYILKNSGGNFAPVYAQIDPGNGIGGYDLKGATDRAFAVDFAGNGINDHIVLYRPGAGAIFILKNVSGQFTPVYQRIDPGNGIGGHDLKSQFDRGFAVDIDKSGSLNGIVLFRPGTGAISVLRRRR